MSLGKSAIGLVTLLTLACPQGYALTPANEGLRTELETRAIRYFLDNANPTSGLILDRAPNFQTSPATNDVASIAATGFGLMVLANAAQREDSDPAHVDRAYVQDYALKVLRFMRDHVKRYHGFFLHFIDWQTGERRWQSEYSTIDSALFMAGALYAAQVFPHTEAADIANQLYLDMDFNDMMTDGGKYPGRRTLSLAYKAEEGYAVGQWHSYSELMILVVLGMAHPAHPLPPEVWTAWERNAGDGGGGAPLMGANMPLFVHQYSQLILDFRTFNDGYPNYYDNSVRATEYNRQVTLEQKGKTFAEGFWGFSAGDAPNAKRYAVYDPTRHDGIVCIDCALGSAVFAPDEILGDAAAWLQTLYHDRIWGRYGFVDSVDVDSNWFSNDVLAITIGPAFLSLANMDPKTAVWGTFMGIPGMREALDKAAHADGPRDLKPLSQEPP